MVIRAPNPFVDTHNKFSVFLSGYTGSDWRKHIEKGLSRFRNIVVFDPKRDDWKPSWGLDANDPEFRRQVEWEITAMATADLIAVYFDPSVVSAISLLEFGLFANTGKVIVCCQDGFRYKGNIDIVCDMYSVKRVGSLGDLVEAIVARSKFKGNGQA